MYEDEITHIAFADEHMVRHLLALLPADALAGLDTRRLRRLPGELIGRGLRGRVADMVWAVAAPTPQRPHAEVLLAIEYLCCKWLAGRPPLLAMLPVFVSRMCRSGRSRKRKA